jgi:hypothetical protein
MIRPEFYPGPAFLHGALTGPHGGATPVMVAGNAVVVGKAVVIGKGSAAGPGGGSGPAALAGLLTQSAGVVQQLLGPARVAQLGERLLLELPDPLPGQA